MSVFFRIYFSYARVLPESVRVPPGPFIRGNLRRDLYGLDFHGPSCQQWIPKALMPQVLGSFCLLRAVLFPMCPELGVFLLALPHLYSEFASSTRIFRVK